MVQASNSNLPVGSTLTPPNSSSTAQDKAVGGTMRVGETGNIPTPPKEGCQGMLRQPGDCLGDGAWIEKFIAAVFLLALLTLAICLFPGPTIVLIAICGLLGSCQARRP